jgi:hypothetical protein
MSSSICLEEASWWIKFEVLSRRGSMIVYVLGTVVLDMSVGYRVLYLRTLAYEVGSVVTY